MSLLASSRGCHHLGRYGSSVVEELPPVLVRMLNLWNGQPVDPAEVYASGCVENGDATFEPQDVLPRFSMSAPRRRWLCSKCLLRTGGIASLEISFT